MHSALYSPMEDAHKHEAFTQRAEESLASPQSVNVPDEELALFLSEISHRSRENAEVARKKLAQRLAE